MSFCDKEKISKSSTNTQDVNVTDSGKNPVSETQKDDKKNTSNIEGAGKSLGELYNNMDENNKKAADVWASQGVDKAVEFMFKHPETGKKMDYATMRYYYG